MDIQANSKPEKPTDPKSLTEPEPPTNENDVQSDIEEPIDAFGFDGNGSDSGSSIPSPGGLSDDDFEVSCAVML